MWNDRIIEAVRSCEEGQVSFGELGSFSIRGASDRREVALQIIRAVRYLGAAEREEAAAEIVRRIGCTAPADIMMTRDMVKSLYRSGMEIGAHTVSHPILGELDADSARYEISESKKVLEELVHSPVDSFAYPNGRYGRDFTERDMMLVKDAGFKTAVSTNWGATSRRSEPFALPRVGLSGDRYVRLGLQICRAYKTSDRPHIETAS
jgi:peptidoglycan/xylan/chitin deacetylase (PgdA/CDA1 family)